MFRIAIITLLLLNVLYFSYTQLFHPWSKAHAMQTMAPTKTLVANPQDAISDVQKEEIAQVRRHPTWSGSTWAATDASHRQCFQVGPLSEQQAQTLPPLIAKTLSSDYWHIQKLNPKKEYWLVYTGGLVSQHEAELAKQRLDIANVPNLGIYQIKQGYVIGLKKLDSEAAATAILKQKKHQSFEFLGIEHHTAQQSGWMLIFNIDEAQLGALQSLQNQFHPDLLEPCTR